MKLTLHPLVHLDILEAMSFYEREGGAKLAADFFLEFTRVKECIVERPLSFVSLSSELRRAKFDRFPFHTIFSIESDHILILVVRHDARHEHFGLDR
ncbi:MAG: type II toxin-antitoxin system RelE/ParE family toxin [Acidobacteria bacterium]|nr:type II toxin-antitoxin system RelE/ParE family toxin [Acidobacteriota bacterium]